MSRPDIQKLYESDPGNCRAVGINITPAGSLVFWEWSGGINLLIHLDLWIRIFEEYTPEIDGEYNVYPYRIKVIDWDARQRLVLAQRIN